jgi:hypothetical protein
VTNRPVPSPLHLAATREVFREAAEGLPQIIAALQDPNSPNGERMSLLSKSDIFGADDRRTEDVHVPEWGGTVRRSSAALSRLFDVACRLSGITDDDVKDLEGNSEPAQSGPSTSASPSPSVALSPNSWHASAPTS